jgi:hypothetical protein
MNIQHTIQPKTDQLNADSLIGGSMTIKITDVKVADGEQPVAIHFEGDNGKPYKPCKSMRRVIVHAWGVDSKAYIGRSLRLFCDPSVTFGGSQVGGIRISHASHIERDLTLALTATRAKRLPYVLKPLEDHADGLRQAAKEGRLKEAWDALPVAEKRNLKGLVEELKGGQLP